MEIKLRARRGNAEVNFITVQGRIEYLSSQSVYGLVNRLDIFLVSDKRDFGKSDREFSRERD